MGRGASRGLGKLKGKAAVGKAPPPVPCLSGLKRVRWEWGGTKWGLSWGSSLTPLLPITNTSGHERARFLRKQDKLKGCGKGSLII